MTVENVGLETIRPSKANHRQKLAIDELAASIEAVGLLHPIVVRTLADDEKKKGENGILYEICAGERRFRAIESMKQATIAATVLTSCDAKQALVITQTENLQREDLSPMEEAAMIQNLLLSSFTAKDIAKMQGKSVAWVYTRKRLLNLSEYVRKEAADESSLLSRWPAHQLELVARLDQEAQKTLVDNFSYSLPTTQELEGSIAKMTMQLKKARWDLNDGALVEEAGPCTSCPQTSAANPGLFDDGTETVLLDNARCLNIECWNRKMEAFIDVKLAQERDVDPKTIAVSDLWYDPHTEREYKGVFLSGDYDKAKKSDEGAIPAVMVDGDGAGKKMYVVPSGKKKDVVVGEDGTVTKKPKTLTERRALLERRRKKMALVSLVDGLPGACPEPAETDFVGRLVLAYGTSRNGATLEWWEDDVAQKDGAYRRLPAAVMAFGDVEYVTGAWVELLMVWEQRFKYRGAEQDLDALWEDALRLCAVIGIDGRALLTDAGREIKEPKSWFNLKEDGTPKLKPVKKAKKK